MIFSKMDETVNLLLPFFVAVFIVSLIFTFGGSLGHLLETDHLLDWIFFFSSIFFLGVIHNVFTLFLIFYLPEIRGMTEGKMRAEGPMFIYQILGIFFASMPIFYFGFLTAPPIAQKLVGTGFAVLAYHHSLKQIYGLSLMYDRGLKKTYQRTERNLYRAQVFVLAVSLLLLIFVPKVCSTAFVRLAFAGALLFCPLAIIWISLQQPQARRSNRTLYLSRLVVLPLAVVWPIMAMGGAYTHGIEYLFVVRHMSRVSKFKMNLAASVFLVLSSLLVAALILPNPIRGLRWVVTANKNWSKVILDVLASLSLSITILHYYLDRVYFRMTDPFVRSHVGPLLEPAHGYSCKIESRSKDFQRPEKVAQ